MALYDYACRKGHITERFTRRREDFLPCPECGEPAERSRVSRPNIGYYESGAIENVRLSTDKRVVWDHFSHRLYADKGGQP